TEAAGATDVEFGETSVPMAEPVTVDRPFIFFIVDNGTGAVLFVGRVLDPTA
ncbi:MAG TPA: serpin family protein, partial [Armatimonadota bacterium]|nr:serpin family protein [Armatimonadota bacterium]